LRRRVRYFIPFVGVHRRSGEQVSGTSSSAILHRERANKVFGKRSARLFERFHIAVLYVLVTTARLPPRQWGATLRRQARGGAVHRCRHLCLVIPITQDTYDSLSLTMLFIPSMIWLGLILLLQYFILNCVMSIFRFIRFLYTTFIMVMIYLWINLKLKLLIFQQQQVYQVVYRENLKTLSGHIRDYKETTSRMNSLPCFINYPLRDG
jgi:hypothetical protein